MAIGALGAAHARPASMCLRELSVVGFDGIAFGADVTSPPLTTVAPVEPSDMAAAAVELLFERTCATGRAAAQPRGATRCPSQVRGISRTATVPPDTCRTGHLAGAD